MPKFTLDLGSTDGDQPYAALDKFTQGYIEAMFFTNTGTEDDEELRDVTFSDLAPETLERIIADCAGFQQTNAFELARAYDYPGIDYDETKAGRDFWYTRNGHGTGFWDRDMRDLNTCGPGGTLSSACGWRTQFEKTDLYLGDDGLLYLS